MKLQMPLPKLRKQQGKDFGLAAIFIVLPIVVVVVVVAVVVAAVVMMLFLRLPF